MVIPLSEMQIVQPQITRTLDIILAIVFFLFLFVLLYGVSLLIKGKRPAGLSYSLVSLLLMGAIFLILCVEREPVALSDSKDADTIPITSQPYTPTATTSKVEEVLEKKIVIRNASGELIYEIQGLYSVNIGDGFIELTDPLGKVNKVKIDEKFRLSIIDVPASER